MENIASAELKGISTKGYLFINNITSDVIKDKNLGLFAPQNSLNLTFFDSGKNTSITESINIDPKAISYDMKTRGLKIALPASINNALCVASSKYNGKFCVCVSEFNLKTSEAVASPFYLDAPVTEKLVLMIDTPELSKTSFANAQTQNLGADANNNASAPDTNNTATTAQSAASTAAATTNTKKKLPIIAIIIGAILLLLLLGALVAYLLGLFGNNAKDDNESLNNTNTEQVATEQDEDNTAKDSDDNDSSQEVVQTSSDNESQESTTVNTQSSQESDNLSSCSIDNPDDAKVIKACISQNADTSKIVNLATQAFENDRCNLGKRLFSSFGRKDANVALAYAKYFDKNNNASSKCENKADTQAIYWYEKAVSLGDLEEAKTALKEFTGK